MKKVIFLILSFIIACNSVNAMESSNSLIYAVIENNLEKAQTLLDSKAEVNWQDPKYGHSALHFVKSIPMAKLLLDHGADINLPAKNNITALDCIIHKEFGEDIDLIQFLLSRGAHINPQDHASLLQWPHILKNIAIELLFKNGAVVHSDNMSRSISSQMTIPMAHRQHKIAAFLISWAAVVSGSKASRLAFCMAMHPRVGADSIANVFPKNVFQEICSYLRPSVLIDDPQAVEDYKHTYKQQQAEQWQSQSWCGNSCCVIS